MNDDFGIDRFAKDPGLLVELYREVIELIDCETGSEKSVTMEAQLREIAKTVERLQKIGVAVPDGLRAEKIRLAAALGIKKESFLTLNLLREGLEKVLKDLNTRLGHVQKRSVKASVRVHDRSNQTKTSNNYSNKGRKLVGFEFLGTYYNPGNWKGLLTIVAELVYEKHKSGFYDNVKNALRGTKLRYFSNSPRELHEPREISNSGIYVETKWDADAIEKRSRDLIKHFGYVDTDLSIDKI
jgi:hypothetical protein